MRIAVVVAFAIGCGSEPAPPPKPAPTGLAPERTLHVPGEILLTTEAHILSRSGTELTITDLATGAQRTAVSAELAQRANECENGYALLTLRNPETEDSSLQSQRLELATGTIAPPAERQWSMDAPCSTANVSDGQWVDVRFDKPRSLHSYQGMPDDYRINIVDEEVTADKQHVVAKLVIFDQSDIVYADDPPPVGFNSRVAWWSATELYTTELAYRYAGRVETSADGKVGALISTSESVGSFPARVIGTAMGWAFPDPKMRKLAAFATAVVVAPDGSWIAAATLGTDGVDLFRPSDGARIDHLPTRERIDSLEISRSGRWLVARGTKTIVWDLRGSRRARVFGPDRLTFGPGDSLVTTDADGVVKIWNLADDGTAFDIAAETVRISANGEHVIIRGGKELRRIAVRSGKIDRAQALPDAQVAITDTGDAYVIDDDGVWSWPVGKPRVKIGEHKRPDDEKNSTEGRLSMMSVLPDGTGVSVYDFASLWRPGKPPVVIGVGGSGSFKWYDNTDPIVASPDGAWLAVELQHAIRLYDLRTLEFVDLDHLYTRLAFAPDGSAFVTGARNFYNEGGRLWKLPSREVRTIPAQDSVRAVAYSRDGRKIVLAGKRLTIYDVAANTSTDVGAPRSEGSITTVEFFGANRLAVRFSTDEVQLWDIATKRGRVVDSDAVLATRVAGDKLVIVTAHAVREIR